MRPSELYAGGRTRIAELARGLSPDELTRGVPGCPQWTVQDVVAHLTGICADAAAGRLDGVPDEAWTDEQVGARRGRSLGDVLEEWAACAAALEPRVDDLGRRGWALAYDVVIHEEDVREALGLPIGDPPAFDVTLDGLVGLAGRRIERAGLPALAVHADGRRWVLGPEPVDAELSAPERDLHRAFSGRRSARVIAGYDWAGDPVPYLPHLPLFTPPAD